MQSELLPLLGLGFLLGLKHALDADHLLAVSTIVSERKGIFSSSAVGALWGIGHTLALLAVGVLVIALQINIPGRVAMAMEFSVAAMLVYLGLRVLVKLSRGDELHIHVHDHGSHRHIHPHTHPFQTVHDHADAHAHHDVKPSSWLQRLLPQARSGRRSILIGMVHGMAGSGSLMLVVLATIPSPAAGFVYIAVFGIGSIGGMVLMSMVIGLPFLVSADRSLALNRLVRGVAGTASILFGIFLGWQIGFVDGLFRGL